LRDPLSRAGSFGVRLEWRVSNALSLGAFADLSTFEQRASAEDYQSATLFASGMLGLSIRF